MNQWYLYSAPIIHVVSLAAVFDLSRNAPPHQGALRDETKTAARGDYYYMPFVYHCFPSLFEFLRPRLSSNRALKQQRRRRVRERNLKSKFALLQTLSRLFHFVQVVGKCRQILCSWILKDCIKIQEKKKNVVVSSSRLPTNPIAFLPFSIVLSINRGRSDSLFVDNESVCLSHATRDLKLLELTSFLFRHFRYLHQNEIEHIPAQIFSDLEALERL